MRVAFYAPMKPPDHAVPSGDRTVARLLIKALEGAGSDVQLASRWRSYRRLPDAWDGASAEAARLISRWNGDGLAWRPDVWFTYHLYYKAPDLIGPAVARALGIPYVVAEASYAAKRNDGPWRENQVEVRAALSDAAAVLTLNQRDVEGIAQVVGPDTQLVDLPPFLDLSEIDAALGGLLPMTTREGPAHDPVRLVTAAMMRSGAKLESYERLARSLDALTDVAWTLDIIGDGDARPAVEKAFARFGDRVTMRGQLEREALIRAFADADVFVWPGIGEAFGMVYLEAQAAGLPVAAIDVDGV
ncbi:MAG: glycosyltransferase family 4 protein, partial [Pseudomonadota bacterium]